MSATKTNHNDVTQLIIDQIESGEVEKWDRPWIPTLSTPVNIKGKTYGVMNNLMVSLHKLRNNFTLRHYMTANAAKKQYGVILKPDQEPASVYGYFSFMVDRDTGEAVKGGDKKKLQRRWSFSVNRVYNVEQFYWKEMPAIFDIEVFENKEIESSEVTKTINDYLDPYLHLHKIPVERGGPSAFYCPTYDMIQMPDLERFVTPEHHAATLAHEVIHSTGHKTRLKRFEERSEEQYSREELIAELGCVNILMHLGINSQNRIKQSAEYMRGWLEPFKENPRMFADADAACKKAWGLIGKAHSDQKKKETKDVKGVLKSLFKRRSK